MALESIDPEMVLGKTVVGPGGSPLGEVADVGLVHRRRVKYLVIRRDDAPLVRVRAEDVEDVGDERVTVRIVPGGR